jgi:hypothetical protein
LMLPATDHRPLKSWLDWVVNTRAAENVSRV